MVYLKKHVGRVHEEDNNYKCIICDKLFYAQSDLKTHHKSHVDAKNYTCHICDKSFSLSNVLRTHIKRVHTELESIFKCKVCNGTYKDH